jgi:hypothetical protein
MPDSQKSERRALYFLIAVLGLAFGLRAWGISFGLPYDFTPDEVHEIVRALKLGAGEYSWIPGKGGLYYFLFVEYGVLFTFWWMSGKVSGAEDFAILYLQDPSAFYLAGRLTVALMGTATCLVVYLISKRLYGSSTALAATFIGATAFFHTMWSHYINVDIGMVLALWSALLVYIVWEQKQQSRWLVFAGALGGIAFAFKLPGIIVVLPILLALVTRPGGIGEHLTLLKSAGLFLLSLLGAALIMAPENVLSAGKIVSHFSGLFGQAVAERKPMPAAELDEAVRQVTVLRGGSYIKILMRDTNIMLALGACAGAVLGVWRRNRWDIILAVFVIVFVGGMSLADRPGLERYLLPVVPAFWLLAARAAAALAEFDPRLTVVGVVAITIVPVYASIEQNYTWTRPDTRVIAKDWIESNIPDDSKILMDGMRYRFIQSPPLRPNMEAVDRRVSRASDAERVSRGVSDSTLRLYAQAMSGLPEPKYDLYSTVYGANVQDLSHYVDECFDYVVTSSQITSLYDSPLEAERSPASALFYRELPTDPRYVNVFSVEPVRWRIQGPEVNVYKVIADCS